MQACGVYVSMQEQVAGRMAGGKGVAGAGRQVPDPLHRPVHLPPASYFLQHRCWAPPPGAAGPPMLLLPPPAACQACLIRCSTGASQRSDELWSDELRSRSLLRNQTQGCVGRAASMLRVQLPWIGVRDAGDAV